MVGRNAYTVGWICAIATESMAAQTFLDEEYGPPESVMPGDCNNYVLGKIGKHHVAIAVLPDAEYGLASVAGVAKDMLHSFPNIRIGLMVGIAGGAPTSKRDIRLGDVVVSRSGDGKGGLFQYDFGKTIQGRKFQTTGFLNQPPTVLRTAVSGLKAQYGRHGHQIAGNIEKALKANHKMKKRFARPENSTDKLYKSVVVHPQDSDADCAQVCSKRADDLVPREERDEDDNPTIHYGLIASANQLMKDAVIRDRLAQEEKVLCFEMEAAGLMNNFPCLVVRGICDYSDTHKNDEWQGYAAMAAAAYAKDLLYQIPPEQINDVEKLSSSLSVLTQTIKNEQAAQEAVRQRKKCHQLLRLTTSDKDTTYEWYKDRVEKRVEGTCAWVLNHENFQTWFKGVSGPLLISADPGCGKSVLSKYLIDHVLPPTAMVCYFFFKEQHQCTVRQALCALLHQLFSKNLDLVDHAIPFFQEEGNGLINSTRSLWKIFEKTIEDSRTGPAVIVLDALDECADSELENLIKNIRSQMDDPRYKEKALRYLMTSRPYHQIVSGFEPLSQRFPQIRIPGEDDSETISQEINSVITYRVDQLAIAKRLSIDLKRDLMQRLIDMKHRTYLWLYLVFDHLKIVHIEKTRRGLTAAIETLPKNVTQAYEQILSKCRDMTRVRKALSIIVAATRPLTLAELNLAVNLSSKIESFNDLELESVEDFKESLRAWCGLFVQVYGGKVYLLHQTAREFLLADLSTSKAQSPSNTWEHSISSRQAHAEIATVCMRFFWLFKSKPGLLLEDVKRVDSQAFTTQTIRKLPQYTWSKWEKNKKPMELRRVNGRVGNHAMNDLEKCADYVATIPPANQAITNYAVANWVHHFYTARIDQTDMEAIQFALVLFDPKSWFFGTWYSQYCYQRRIKYNFSTTLEVAAYFGLYALAEVLLQKGVDKESKEKTTGRTPLLLALHMNHEDVIDLLLRQGADVNAESTGLSAFFMATRHCGKETIRSLIKHGAATGIDIYKALWEEATSQAKVRIDVVEMLILSGADVNAQREQDGWPLLLEVSMSGDTDLVKVLLDYGADITVSDEMWGNALHIACYHGHELVVNILLEYGFDVNARGGNHSTALAMAAYKGHKSVVKMLLAHGVDIDQPVARHMTALGAAFAGRSDEVIEQLLRSGATFFKTGLLFSRAISYLTEYGRTETIRLLQEQRADYLLARGSDVETDVDTHYRHSKRNHMSTDIGEDTKYSDLRSSDGTERTARDGRLEAEATTNVELGNVKPSAITTLSARFKRRLKLGRQKTGWSSKYPV